MTDSFAVRHSQVVVPPQTHKILPHDFTEASLLQGQSNADWSAIYAQFTIPHAVSYLPNHFDRGVTDAVLVVIKTKQALPCVIYDDLRVSVSSTPSILKAKLIYDYLRAHIASSLHLKSATDASQVIPLLQAIGEQMKSFLVLYDAEKDMECVIPHNMMTNDHFTYEVIARFSQDEKCPWRVKTCSYLTSADSNTVPTSTSSEEQRQEEVHLALSKDEKEDASLLGCKLRDILTSVLSASQMVTWMDTVDSSK